MHAALWLVAAFFSARLPVAALYAEFLAIVLVLVYVGAVMVLFLFVVMMLDISFDKLREGFWRHLPLAGRHRLPHGAGDGARALLARVRRGRDALARARRPPGPLNTKELGRLIYTDYVFPFELAAVVLLVAIVAAIAPSRCAGARRPATRTRPSSSPPPRRGA